MTAKNKRSENGTERLPPQSRAAERELLGAMIRNNDNIGDMVQFVHARDFSADAHQRVFAAIVHLWDARQPVTLTLLAEELHRRGHIEDIGGHAYLSELWEESPTGACAEHYARIVRDRALLRELVRTTTEILSDAYSPTDSAEATIEQAEQKIFAIGELGSAGKSTGMDVIVKDALKWMDRRASDPNADGVASGFMDLDDITGGCHNGELTLIAARPSVGKTGLALAIARNVARAGQPVLFVSLEQGPVELGARLLCAASGVDGDRVRRGKLTPEQVDAITEAAERVAPLPIIVDHSPGQSAARIAANCRRLHRRHGIKLVILDYLQLVEPDRSRDTREQEVAGISRRLKLLARDLNVPVIALCQLNRQLENRADPEPRLADLRDSGSLEQDADTVLLLWKKEGEGTVVYAKVAKQRNGPLGVLKLSFTPSTTAFDNYAPL